MLPRSHRLEIRGHPQRLPLPHRYGVQLPPRLLPDTCRNTMQNELQYVEPRSTLIALIYQPQVDCCVF